MTTIKQRIDILSRIPPQLCLALAAGCAERALTEAEKANPTVMATYPVIRQGVELMWRKALNYDLDLFAEARALLPKINKPLPEDQDDPQPDAAVLHTAGAVSTGLGLVEGEDQYARYAASVCGKTVALFNALYEGGREVRDAERAWVDQAIDLVVNHGDKLITRDMFALIPDYPRPPLSQDYLQGEEI